MPNDTVSFDKSILRQLALAQRYALSPAKADQLSEKIIATLIKRINWENYSTVHLYLPHKKQHEINTWPLIEFLWQQHPNIRIISNRLNRTLQRIDCYAIDQHTSFEKDAWGIPEPLITTPAIDPQQIDLMILPLLACDHEGYRLGYGKGYYDRLLASCSPSLQRIGINYFAPLENNIPHESHDIPLTQLITSMGYFNF